jgi:hypothetical protein
MELDFIFRYLKMCWQRKSTPIACRVKKGQMVKTSEDHNFILENQNWENK